MASRLPASSKCSRMSDRSTGETATANESVSAKGLVTGMSVKAAVTAATATTVSTAALVAYLGVSIVWVLPLQAGAPRQDETGALGTQLGLQRPPGRALAGKKVAQLHVRPEFR